MPWWSPRSLVRRFGDLLRAEVATFASGCFWRVEVQFRELGGVIDTPGRRTLTGLAWHCYFGRLHRRLHPGSEL